MGAEQDVPPPDGGQIAKEALLDTSDVDAALTRMVEGKQSGIAGVSGQPGIELEPAHPEGVQAGAVPIEPIVEESAFTPLSDEENANVQEILRVYKTPAKAREIYETLAKDPDSYIKEIGDSTLNLLDRWERQTQPQQEEIDARFEQFKTGLGGRPLEEAIEELKRVAQPGNPADEMLRIINAYQARHPEAEERTTSRFVESLAERAREWARTYINTWLNKADDFLRKNGSARRDLAQGNSYLQALFRTFTEQELIDLGSSRIRYALYGKGGVDSEQLRIGVAELVGINLPIYLYDLGVGPDDPLLMDVLARLTPNEATTVTKELGRRRGLIV